MTNAGPEGQKTLSGKMNETVDIAADLVEVVSAKTSNATVAMLALMMAAVDVWHRCKKSGASWDNIRKIFNDLTSIQETEGYTPLDELQKIGDMFELVATDREGSA